MVTTVAVLSLALGFGVEGYDTTVIGGAALVVLAVAIGAGIMPTRRAAAVNPIEAQRVD